MSSCMKARAQGWERLYLEFNYVMYTCPQPAFLPSQFGHEYNYGIYIYVIYMNWEDTIVNMS